MIRMLRKFFRVDSPFEVLTRWDVESVIEDYELWLQSRVAPAVASVKADYAPTVVETTNTPENALALLGEAMGVRTALNG